MNNPQPHSAMVIDAETPGISRCLCAIEQVLKHGGAQIHPGLCIVERGGHFTIYCTTTDITAGQHLFHLPLALLIPVDGIQWADSQQTLALAATPDHLSTVQRQLLDLHIELYNLTKKLEWAVHNHPQIALQSAPHLLSMLSLIQPDFTGTPAKVADVFLQTRVFHLTVASDADAGKNVLMPLIELLNHHPKGAAFQVGNGALFMAVKQPMGQTECFARYGGHRDALDLALHYGYADLNTPFAHSAPVKVTVRGLAHIRVQGLRMKAAHALTPPRITLEEGGVVLSHLVCDRQHPQRLNAVLHLVVQLLTRRYGLPAQAEKDVQQELRTALYQANAILLADLHAAATALASTLPAAALVMQAIRQQARIMEETMV